MSMYMDIDQENGQVAGIYLRSIRQKNKENLYEKKEHQSH